MFHVLPLKQQNKCTMSHVRVLFSNRPFWILKTLTIYIFGPTIWIHYCPLLLSTIIWMSKYIIKLCPENKIELLMSLNLFSLYFQILDSIVRILSTLFYRAIYFKVNNNGK